MPVTARKRAADPRGALGKLIIDPVDCATGIFQADLWPTQQQILWSVAKNRRTAVKACHASSKTHTAARAALWWLLRYPDGVVVTTSSSWIQVERQLWGEIRDAWEASAIQMPEPNKTELNIGPKHYAIGISTNLGVRFRGFHSGHVLIVIDEPQGIISDVWEEIDGIMAGGHVHLLAIGNPTVPGGPFHDAFTVDLARWNTITIDAFSTPNLAAYRTRRASPERAIARLAAADETELMEAERPYLISRIWVREKIDTWGLDNPRFQSRVLGRFPAQMEDALLQLGWLEDARNRPSKWKTKHPVDVGIDVAAGGESETVVYIVQGPQIVEMHHWELADPRGQILGVLRPWRDYIKRCNVDASGVGYYLAQHLKDQGLPVKFIKVGERARTPERFVNLRAELMFGLSERFEQGDVNGLTDETTVAQLSTIRTTRTARDQDAIESKVEARKRGVRSPDRAEALMLAYAGRIPRKGRKKLRRLTYGRSA